MPRKKFDPVLCACQFASGLSQPNRLSPDIGLGFRRRSPAVAALHALIGVWYRRELPQQRLFWNKSSIYQLNLLLRAGTPKVA